jgi:hypothetical protein
MATSRGPGGVGGPPKPAPADAPQAEKPAQEAKPVARKPTALPPKIARQLGTATDERGERQKNQDALLGEGRIGEESVTAEELKAMGTLVGARHLMVLLAKKRGEDRAKLLEHVGNQLIEIDEPELVRRLLMEMPDAGRIVDIYPLEVLAYVLERRPDLLLGFSFEQFVLNKEDVEAQIFEVEQVIVLKIPLAMRLRAFALDGGGTPGYCLAPGAPGEYHLEIGEAGTFHLLLRGEVRKRSFVDRLILRVEDRPDSP